MVETEGFKAAIAAGKKKPRINIIKPGKTNCRASLKDTGIKGTGITLLKTNYSLERKYLHLSHSRFYNHGKHRRAGKSPIKTP